MMIYIHSFGKMYIFGNQFISALIDFQICYDSPGKPNVLKKNLRQFAGFDFDKDSDQYKEKLEETEKVDIAKLKAICDGLQLDKKGSKEELSARICEFLLAPDGEEEEEDASGEEEEEEESGRFQQALCFPIGHCLI